LTRCTLGGNIVYMNTIRVSATAARNNFFDLLDKVAIGVSVVIEKDKKTVAYMAPMTRKDTKYKGLTKALHAAAKGFVYVKRDNPLRKPGAMKFLTDRHTA